MKRIGSIVLVCLLVVGVSTWAIAQEAKAGAGEKEMKQGAMMEKGMMEHGKMMERCKMTGMCPMMHLSLVATSDGGVIVLAGNKLQKFDKDLMLQKEVEIKMDMESMKKMMMGMCPMMGDKMKEGAAEKAKEEMKR